MTVALMICVVPPQGTPFVMIATDSKATTIDGEVVTNHAKKIFDAGNALMSTSGAADDEYREYLARVLATEETLERKIMAVKPLLIEDKRDYGLQLNVGIAQIDSQGNPQMAFIRVNPLKEDIDIGPITYPKEIPCAEHFYFGESRTPEVDELRNELNEKLVSGKMNRSSVEEAAKWFIRKVAKIYPETVNAIVQTKVIWAK